MSSSIERNKANRPTLDENISLDDYLNYYWLKKELMEFCRKTGVNSEGWKLDIHARIIAYLSGKQVVEKKRIVSNKVVMNQEKPSLETIITESFKRNPETTAFFREIAPNFHYSVRLNQYIRDHVGGTYQDILDEWNKEYEARKRGIKTTPPLPQCEYNQFIKDYLADNKDKNFRDAVSAWNIKKTMRGDNIYHREEMSLYLNDLGGDEKGEE